MKRQFRRQCKVRNQRAGALAEFGPVMFIFFVVIFLPLMGLFTFIEGVTTIAFATNIAAREAGTASSRTTAIANMNSVGDRLIGGPFGRFAGLTPADHNGMKLFVLQVPVAGGSKQEFEGTNQVPTINTNDNFYEYQVRSTYDVKPLFIPKSIPMSWASAAHVEHPNGLNN